MPVIPAVSYLPTRLAGCSVGPGIRYGARKLARTPRVKKKKKRMWLRLTNSHYRLITTELKIIVKK